MLIQFSVENYLSFQKETILSMLPAKSRIKKEHIIHCNQGKKASVIPLAAFYGANASGKSNFIKAIAFFRSIILGEKDTVKSIPVTPFKLDEDNITKPSRFEIIFKFNGIVYTYGIVISASAVSEEWLFACYTAREVKLFERVTDTEGKTEIVAGPFFAKSIKGGQKAVDLLASILSPRKLFITECFERGGISDLLKPVTDWFENCLHILSPDAKCITLPVKADLDENFLKFFNDFIVSSDTGIAAISSKREPFDPDIHLKNIPSEIKDKILADIEKAKATKAQKAVLTIQGLPKIFNIIIDKTGKVFYVQLKIQHKDNKGKEITFEFFEESDGTQKLMHLTPVLQTSLEREQVYVLDELDCKMHPLLSVAFLNVFLQGVTKHGAKSQIIFTTHDTNLLNSELFRKDEVLFVEKDQGGGSHLTSLAEYQVADGLRIGNGYLFGRFGAIPYLKKMTNILK